MNIAATTITLLALAGLTGCSGPAAPPPASNETSADVAPTGDVGIVAPPAVGNLATPSPTPGASPVAMTADAMLAEPQGLATFPNAFRGRWGMNAADCDPARADNKGLITVSSDRIKFYESVARPVELTMSGKKLTADLSFSGEGQSWKSRTVFELIGSGSKLVRTEETPAASYSYSKCAA